MAIVTYRGALAYYRIGQESKGIYFANLEDYDGSMHNLPPTNLTLTRGLIHWKGSTNEQSLVDDLGEVIDNNLHRDHPGKEGSPSLKNKTGNEKGDEEK